MTMTDCVCRRAHQQVLEPGRLCVWDSQQPRCLILSRSQHRPSTHQPFLAAEPTDLLQMPAPQGRWKPQGVTSGAGVQGPAVVILLWLAPLPHPCSDGLFCVHVTRLRDATLVPLASSAGCVCEGISRRDGHLNRWIQ